MKRSIWVAFVGLCLLSGSSWVVPRYDGLATLEQQGLIYGVIGLIGLLFSKRQAWSLGGGLWLVAGVVGFFGLPMLVVEYAAGSMGETSRSALFAMVPVVVVLVAAAGADERGARRFLVPALVGLGGLLLLLPFEVSGSLRGWLMLALVSGAVIVVGITSVWLYRWLGGVSFWDAIAIVGLANSIFLLAGGWVRGELVWRWSELSSVVSISSLVDVVEIGLIVWLLGEMPPIRFAARSLLIPLVTVLESFVLVRPELTARLVGGTVLLAAGVGMMLFLKDGDEEAVLSLR